MKNRILNCAASFALVFWVGATWAAGYVFAPILFASYNTVQAGDIAGKLFYAVQQIGLVCAMIILFDYRVRYSKKLLHQRNMWVLLVILCGVLVQHLGLTPMLEKAKMLGDMSQFARLHGISQMIYLLQSLGLGYLVYQKITH